jgi:hypothetical protein
MRNHLLPKMKPLKLIHPNNPIPKIIPVYIGFTTIPSRLEIGHTAHNLSILLKNTFLPEKIILSIPSKTLKGNTYPLHLLQQEPFINPRVHIHFVEKDKGPLLKLSGLLDYLHINQIKPEYIMLMDDDIVYPQNIIQVLWRNHFHFPKMSLGFIGRKWNAMMNRAVNHNLRNRPIAMFQVQFLETYHMALHPTSLFLDNYEDWKKFIEFQIQICPESIWTDDIVIGLWGTLQKIPKFIIKGPPVRFNNKNTPKLSVQNTTGRNDRVFRKIFLPFIQQK